MLRDFIMLAMPSCGRLAAGRRRDAMPGARGAVRARGVELAGLARPVSFSRCTLPITALRVTPSPRSPAIWLAVESLHPEFLQQLDALFSPAHTCIAPKPPSRRTPSPRCRDRLQPAENSTHRRSEGSATRDIVSQRAGYYTARRIRDKSPGPGFPGENPGLSGGVPKLESNQALGGRKVDFDRAAKAYLEPHRRAAEWQRVFGFCGAFATPP